MAARGHVSTWAVLAAALLGAAPRGGQAQTLPAFSGADGAARNVSGGRGGIVYHVTKVNSALDDPERDSFGTIRYGLNNANFPSGVPRTIVFDVGGVFHLGRLPQAGWDPNGNGWDPQSRLTIGGTNITLAGQTAPGSGVIFMGGGLKPQGNNNIIRNITVAAGYGMRNWWQPGEAFPSAPVSGDVGAGNFPDVTVFDAMDIAGTNLMIDHVSMLYATDETISMNEAANNITVQYSNISQGQNYPQWDSDSNPQRYTGHAFGSLLSAASNAAISFHHNLYAHQKSRVPQVGVGKDQASGAFYDFRNNVFYNWLGTAGSKSGTTSVNLASNFYLAGDGGDDPIGGTNPGMTTQGGGTGVMSASSSVYRHGNLLDSNKDADANDGVSLSAGGAAAPLWAGGVATYHGVTDTASQAFSRVLDYVGANWWNRDGVIDTPDERIINEVRTGEGKIIGWADNPWNSDPSEGAEWRALKNTPTTSRPADWDVDQDGLPGMWEAAHGLNPAVADNNGDFDSDGYTNLEEYLNEIAAWPAPAAIQFTGETNNRYAQITNWDANFDAVLKHHWQPSRFDTAVVSSGTAVVDAVGQHAGELHVATKVGDMATLEVTAGWIEVAERLSVGSAGSGTVNHSGGAVAAPLVIVGGGAAASGVYNLSGSGVLRVGALVKGPVGASGDFNFTGGVLSADVVAFDLVNQGGVIAPGASPGTMLVTGDLTMESGRIVLELAGSAEGQYDKLAMDDALTAGGTLEVKLLDGFSPGLGEAFHLLSFSTASGGFRLELPELEEGLAWDASNLLITGELRVTDADFDGDQDVDGSDFLAWQRGAADAIGLALWQARFGESSAGNTVPEPATWVAAAMWLALGAARRRA